MKIFECKKTNTKRIFKFFGLTIYHLEHDYLTSERTQSFLGGLITTLRVNNVYTCHIEKNIKFLGKTIAKRIEDENNRTYYLANIPVKKISLEKIFIKNYFKYLDKKYDDIYIINANSGEIYLFLTHVLDAALKKNNSKAPLLLATKKYHMELIKMICPEIPCVLIKKFKHNIKKDSFKIDNFRFFMVFSQDHFIKVELDIKNKRKGEAHYFKSILERFNISQDEISMRKIQTTTHDEESVINKAQNANLNLNNFIFIAPEARSCELIDNKFWIALINDYNAKGFDIFVNLSDDMLDLTGAKYKSFDISFVEAFVLAKKAKKIITLRSGINELLMQTGVETEVLYTRFKHREFSRDMTVEHIVAGFSLMQLPNYKKEAMIERIYN